MRLPSQASTIATVIALPLLALGACSSNGSSSPSGKDASGSTQPEASSPDLGKDASGSDLGKDASDTAPAEAGETGKASVYFVKQAAGTTTASMADGSISVSSSYSASGNAFKYVAPNYYGTASNGFISFPEKLSGDFSISAEITITTQNKANNACGIGLGMTTGWAPTDTYGYVLMRNSSNVAAGYYVNAAGSVSAGAPSVPFTNGTPLALSFVRSGNKITMGAGPVAGNATTTTLATSSFTDGSDVFGWCGLSGDRLQQRGRHHQQAGHQGCRWQDHLRLCHGGPGRVRPGGGGPVSGQRERGER
jgi:hypothetical protein